MARCLSLLLVESTPPANKNSLVSSARGREKCCSRSRSGKKLESKLLSKIIQSPSPSLFPPLHPPPQKKRKTREEGGEKIRDSIGIKINTTTVEIRNTIFLVETDLANQRWKRDTQARHRVEFLCVIVRVKEWRWVASFALASRTFLSVCVCVLHKRYTCVCARAWSKSAVFIDDRHTTERPVHQTHFHCTIIPISIASVVLQRGGILP